MNKPVISDDSCLEKLKESRYGNDLDIDSMMENFEKSVKPTFKDAAERSFVKFGSMRDRDPSVGIRSGQLSLEGCVCVVAFVSRRCQ